MAWYDITGTVSDWIMAGVAVYAAANAKDWIKQRKDEDAYILAKEIIFKDLNELLSTVFEIYSHNSKLDIYTQHVGYDLDVHCTTDECNRALEMLMKGGAEIINIQRNLNKLSRLGWNFTKKSSDSFEEIRSAYIKLHSNHRDFWTEVKALKLKANTNLGSPDYVQSKLILLDDCNTEFQLRYKKFHELYVNFDQYFDKTSTKK